MSNEEKIKKEIAKALGIDQEYIECDKKILSEEHRPYEIRNWFIKNKSSNKVEITKMDLNIFEKYNLDFEKCHFLCDIIFETTKEPKILNNISFKCCEFKNHKINFKNIEIQTLSINLCKFKSNFNFYKTKIKDFRITKSRFYNQINFLNCDILDYFGMDNNFCKGCFSLHSQNIQKAKFEFNKNLFNGFKMVDVELNSLWVHKTKFKKYINLKYCNFKKNCNFKECNFIGLADFSSSNFKGEVYFNNSIFEKIADFHGSNFYQTACFYGVDFKSIPNFSGVHFTQKSIFTNSEFEFDKIKRDCKTEFERIKMKDSNNTLLRVISDFRISFALIKNVLNKDGNLLDASTHHKHELYCKELELSDELEINLKDGKDDISLNTTKYNNKQRLNITKAILFIWHCIYMAIYAFANWILCPICKIFIFLLLAPIFVIISMLYILKYIKNILCFLFSRQEFVLYKKIKNKLDEINSTKILNLTKWLDYATLHIYRNTSDHHTNFAKILNFTIGMVVVFGFMELILVKLNEVIIYKFNEASLIYVMLMFIVLMFFSLIPNKITQNGKNFITVVFFTISSLIIAATYVSFMSNVAFSILAYISCICLYYFVFSSKKIIPVIIARIPIYIIFISIIIIKPALLNPLFGVFQNENLRSNNLETTFMFMKYNEKEKFNKFLNENNITINFNNKKEILNLSKRNLENLINILKKSDENMDLIKAIKSDISSQDITRSVSIIYTIIMLLCVYSLTKTARKNSIIQN